LARIIDTAELTQQSALSENHSLWIYNGLDCCVTEEVRKNLSPMLDNVALSTYEFSKALQAPVLEMSMRGLLVNQPRKHRVLSEMRKKLAVLQENFDTIQREGIGIEPINWRSPMQLNNLLYDVMGLPEKKKRNSKGVYARSSNREAIEALSVYYIAEPICNYLLAMRDLGKSIGFLETGIDPDGRMRSNFNIAGTNTGRFASSVSDFGTGCVRPTAEALTPFGWKQLKDLKDGDIIAQYNNGAVEFVPASFHWEDFSGDLISYTTEQITLTVTPDHRVLSKDYKGRSVTTTARDTFINYSQRQIPVAGKYVGGSKTVPAYLAMLMADCSKEGTVWRASWKKDRKLVRFFKLMKEAGITYNEVNTNRTGYSRYTIYADINLPKTYGPWILDLTYESARALVDEAKYWDAHIRGNSFIFYTADKEEAKWFQTLCHLVGYGTTLRLSKNSKEAYGNQSIIYSVNVKPRDHVQVLRKHWGYTPYEGKVGCPQVPSTYWLVRENGFISVTGNTNLQNVTASLRSVFVADPGYKLANLDLEQADSRNVGALCWNAFVESHGEKWAGAYLDLCESGDLHTNVCKMASPNLGWGELVHEDGRPWSDREIADQPAYRHKTYRDNAKVLGHGSNYLGTPPTMASHSKLPRKLVEEFQKNYFSALPCIPEWHKTIFYELEQFSFLTTPFGRRRYFFGRPKEAATRREAVAYQPQSMTADEINTGILNLWRANRVQLLVQVHDSILFQYPEELEDEIVPWALETLKTYLALAKGREFVVPTEAMTGWNWGYHDEKENPDGLKKWKGHDDRKRQEKEFKLSLRGL